MEKYLVIGDPVAHSRSPGMQNAAFSFYGLGKPYGRRRVPVAELPDFLDFARKNLSGVNLTVPLKAAVLPLLEEVEDTARLARSVNTLVIRDGRVRGYSTDGIGLERALESCFHTVLAGKRLCFLGSGGVVWAAALHAARSGAGAIRLINRTLAHAQTLADRLRCAFPEIPVEIASPGDLRNVRRMLENSDLLIQGTSLGLHPEDPPPVDLALLTPELKLAVFDMIYRPTPLLARAAALGLPHADGAEMLIHQGAASFELWTGLTAPLEEMRRGFYGEKKEC